jgi:hypothetical protein
MSRAISLADRKELRLCGTGKPGVGALQCDQRRLDIAGELQLLHGNDDSLLDFGQHALVASCWRAPGTWLPVPRPGSAFRRASGLQHTDLGLLRGQRFLHLPRQACAPPWPSSRCRPGVARVPVAGWRPASGYRPIARRPPPAATRPTRKVGRAQGGAPAAGDGVSISVCGEFPWGAKYCTRPAIRPSSPGPVGTTLVRPRACACSAMRACGTKAGVLRSQAWPRRPTMSKKLRRPSLLVSVTASSRPSSQSLSRGAGSSAAAAPIAAQVFDAGAARLQGIAQQLAPAVAAKNDHALARARRSVREVPAGLRSRSAAAAI